MKKLTLILSCVMLVSTGFAQDWQWQNPWPQSNTLNDVIFVDALEGWCVGYGGAVLHTSDGGVTWEMQDAATETELNAVDFIDVERGWAVGRDGTIRHTTDGGSTWSVQELPVPIGLWLDAVEFTDENNGWIIGDGCFHTTNGGSDWTSVMVPGFPFLADVCFLDELTGWVLGRGNVSHTTDGGETWEQTHIPHAYGWGHIEFIDNEHGWVMSDDSTRGPTIYRTTDGGATWSLPNSPWQLTADDFCFSDAMNGWAVAGWGGWSTMIAHSTDGGETWSTMYLDLPGLDDGLLSVSVPDGVHGWAVGEYGVIMRTTDSGGTWTNELRTATYAGLAKVSFADLLHGVAVGTYFDWEHSIRTGYIVRTTNGGIDWMAADSVADLMIRGVTLSPAGFGWAVGEDGLVLRTLDYGASWEQQSTPSNEDFNDVKTLDGMTAWAVGSGAIVRTLSGGTFWVLMRTDTIYHLAVCALNSQSVWVAGSDGSVLHSADGGYTWEPRNIPAYWDCLGLSSIAFVNENRGWVWGEGFCHGGDIPSYVTWETTDGGVTWEMSEENLAGITFSDALNGWAFGYQSLLHTTDGGDTWVTEADIPYNGLSYNGLYFADATHGWAVGYNGAILYHSGETNVPPGEGETVPQAYALSAYPNPFNASTHLSYEIPATTRVNLSVFDLTGRLVRTLEDRVMLQGTHAINFDASDLPSGMYFLRLNTASLATTQKLLLLK